MDKYVSRDDVRRFIADAFSENRFATNYDYAILFDEIDELPAADVQPVKHGKWCPPLMGQGKFATYCSMCQYTVMRNAAGIFEETPFCPHCGADMRGDNVE